jgi:invasion protein IalB
MLGEKWSAKRKASPSGAASEAVAIAGSAPADVSAPFDAAAEQEKARSKSREVVMHWSSMCKHATQVDSLKAMRCNVLEEMVELDKMISMKRNAIHALPGIASPAKKQSTGMQ